MRLLWQKAETNRTANNRRTRKFWSPIFLIVFFSSLFLFCLNRTEVISIINTCETHLKRMLWIASVCTTKTNSKSLSSNIIFGALFFPCFRWVGRYLWMKWRYTHQFRKTCAVYFLDFRSVWIYRFALYIYTHRHI